ncbi:MAG: hypothetical protein JWM19_5538 [Actinomycetia bacterium]|nr:hypothetical protein [Actinomycetes bacterium]
MTHSRDERLALATLLAEKGPDAPTLCAGWKTGDLAAHLVLRETRPDAAAGAMGGPLAGYTARALQRLAGRVSFAELVEAFRNGPPRFSPFALPRMDAMANTVEYFVHHEDVRRAAEGWTARELDPALSDELWARLKSGARFFLGKAPVGLELVRTDTAGGAATATAATATAEATAGSSDAAPGSSDAAPGNAGAAPSAAPVQYRITAKRATPVVTVSGTPAELTLWTFGRISGSHVTLDGPKAAIHKLQAWRR